jgi:hypothetical protein
MQVIDLIVRQDKWVAASYRFALGPQAESVLWQLDFKPPAGVDKVVLRDPITGKDITGEERNVHLAAMGLDKMTVDVTVPVALEVVRSLAPGEDDMDDEESGSSAHGSRFPTLLRMITASLETIEDDETFDVHLIIGS